MKESDWKKFTKIKTQALEKFCAGILESCENTIQEKETSNHEKYLDLYKLITSSDKQLGQIFNGHSRSSAFLQLMLMRREGLVEERQLEGLSDELLKSLKPIEYTNE